MHESNGAHNPKLELVSSSTLFPSVSQFALPGRFCPNRPGPSLPAGDIELAETRTPTRDPDPNRAPRMTRAPLPNPIDTRPIDLEPDDSETGRLPAWITETPYWAVSVVVHLIALLVIGGIVMSRADAPSKPSNSIIKRETRQKPFEPLPPTVNPAPIPVTSPLDSPYVSSVQPVKPTTPRPSPVNLRSDRSVFDAFDNSIGLSGTPAGAFKGRHKGSGVDRGGGEDAVRKALQWLMRHQHPDGHWSSHAFYTGNGNPAVYAGEQLGFEGFDVGVTGLAMLAFLGYGHTHRDGEYPEYRAVVKRAMNWMLAQQTVDPSHPERDGCFGANDREEWIYNHAIATMAMSELLLMSRDRFKLGRSVESATEYCFRAQNPGYGWKYGYRSGRNDTSVTGWMVLALKASKVCASLKYIKRVQPEDFRPHIDGALTWFDRATGKQSGTAGYEGPGDEGSRLQTPAGSEYRFSKRLSCMTAVSVLCRLFADESKRSPAVKDGIAILMKQPPRWAKAIGKRKSTINFYYWYYGSYALFQYGGPKWLEWNKAMLETLLPSQIVGTEKDGSWDPAGEWGPAGGRVYTTAIAAMTLEVYYRYRRLNP